MNTMDLFSRDFALDIGTSNLRVYVKNVGIVTTEPSIVAIRKRQLGRKHVEAVGIAAFDMAGRTPDDLELVHPVKSGVIAEFDCTAALLQNLIPQAPFVQRLFGPRIVIAVPTDLTNVERRAVCETARQLGAREVVLVDSIAAAAIGAGLPATRSAGNFIVDIGGGKTEIAVVSLGGIVCSHTSRVAGSSMTEALVDYVKMKHNLLIGDHTAELLKVQLGTAYPIDDMSAVEIGGRCRISGDPKVVEINSEESREALSESVASIVDGVRQTLDRTPPELAADIFDRGIVMVGGGSLLANLDVLLREVTGLPVVLADDPLNTVAKGVGRIVDDPEYYQDFTTYNA
jgi:rod shape-determining protein MreB